MLPGWVTWSCGAGTSISDSQCCRDSNGAWLFLKCFVSLPNFPTVLGVRAPKMLLVLILGSV